jgi:hypothetical protein
MRKVTLSGPAGASDRLLRAAPMPPREGRRRERGHGHPRAFDAHYAPEHRFSPGRVVA